MISRTKTCEFCNEKEKMKFKQFICDKCQNDRDQIKARYELRCHMAISKLKIERQIEAALFGELERKNDGDWKKWEVEKERVKMAKKVGNQYTVDPRQALFVQYYLDSESETFANGLKSAIKAGYSEEYAKVLTAKMPNWLSDKVRDSEIIKKAEKNLKEFLEMEAIDAPHKKIKADMTKFTLERLNKKKYSQRSEIPGEEGNEIVVTIRNTGKS